MTNAKKALAFISLVALAAANAFAYVSVNQLILIYGDESIPPHYPILPLFVAAFARTALLAAAVTPLVASTLSPKRRSSWIAVSATSLALLSFALASGPLSSVDNSWNVLSARNMVVHGANPYLTPAGSFPDDPAYHRIWGRWYAMPMVYGPLWTALSAIPILIAGEVRSQTLGMLVLNVLGYALAGVIICRWLYRRDPQKAWYVAVFWMLNVYAGLEIANAGHNEGVMLPFLALLATALVDENLVLAAVGVVGAALIKHWPLAIAPALLAIPSSNRRRLAAIAVSAMALVLGWLPFWAGRPTLAGAFSAATYGREPFVFSPYRYAAWFLLVKLNGYTTVTQLRISALGVSLAMLAIVTYLAYRRRITPTAAALVILGTYHFIWLSWLQPWYLLAFLPFIVTSLEKTKAVVAMGMLGVVGILCYQYGSPKVTGTALLVTLWLAALRFERGKGRESSATTAPQAAPSEVR